MPPHSSIRAISANRPSALRATVTSESATPGMDGRGA
jgi:hypothetical protein